MRPPASLRALTASIPLALTLACGAPPAARDASGGAPATQVGLPVAATSPLYAYETQKLADGVYAFVVNDPHGGLVSSNTLVVIGDDGVLVVDTGHFPSLARKMIGDIRKLTDRPVRYVVNTHWHPDHLFGNGAYQEAFPGVAIVGHEETRRLALKKDPEQVATQRNIAKAAKQFHDMLSTGEKKPGVPLDERDRLIVASTTPEIDATLGDAQVDLVAPTTTFDGEGMAVYLGKREVRVLHLGRGNTAGDVVVYVPDARVVAAGDIVVAPVPYAYGSYFAEWGVVLEKLAALDARVLLPGHGPVETDMTYVKTLEALLASVRRQASDAVKAGLSLEDARKKIDVSELRQKIAGDDPLRRLEFDVCFTEPGVARAYEEAQGKLSDE